jgi:hypothetical protein
VASLKARSVPAAKMPTVVGVYWTSMALPEELNGAAKANGGLGVATATGGGPSVDPKVIADQLDALKRAFGGGTDLDRARALLDTIEDRPNDRAAFVDALRSTAPPTTDPDEDNSDRFFGDDVGDLFAALTDPPLSGGAVASDEGAAAGLGDVLSGVGSSLVNTAQGALGSAFRLVNYLTFYQMKERAGVIGGGVNAELGKVRAKFPQLPIHLVGHSFGARVVTAAAARGANLNPCSLSLLQAAYSHNGLAAAAQWEGQKDGYFRAIFVQKRVAGPIIATYTVNDQAVGITYPIASRLAGQNASALGDANDPFGGVGRNGILHVLPGERGPAISLLAPGGVYAFAAGKTNNLLADAYVKNHGDVTNPAVGNAVAQVVASL